MKTHMRIPMYNDRRPFGDAIQAGMRQTTRYAKCWHEHVALTGANATDENARAAAWHPGVRDAVKKCAPMKFHGNLFQAYVLKSAYYYQLLPWFHAMPGKVRVLTLETLDATSLRGLVEEFLGLPFLGAGRGYRDEGQVKDLVTARRNVARDGGVQTISDEHRKTLDDFFRPMNRKLDALLGWRTGYPV